MKKYTMKDVGLVTPVNIIVAVDETGGFGKDGKIPWHFPEDLKHFQSITKNTTCIMGRKTYQDMLEMVVERKKKKSPKEKIIKIDEILPGRECFVVSRTLKTVQGATVVPRLRKAMVDATKKEIFVIGGELMYTEALPWTKMIHLTVVKGHYNCDRFFPLDYLDKHFKIAGGKKISDNLLYVKYKRVTPL